MIFRAKLPNASLLLDLILDGKPLRRRYHSPKYWAAVFHFAAAEGCEVIVRDIDLPGRFMRLFPPSLLGQIRWFENYHGDCPPVARLFDPNGTAEILLLRSLADGLAMDVVHNLQPGGYTRETVWLADIMALRPMLGIDLVRDVTFAPTLPISVYLEAAASTGRLAEEPELFTLPLTGIVAKEISRGRRRHDAAYCVRQKKMM